MGRKGRGGTGDGGETRREAMGGYWKQQESPCLTGGREGGFAQAKAASRGMDGRQHGLVPAPAPWKGT